MIYSRNNAAKQWIFEALDRRFGQRPTRVLDLGCGDAGNWKSFVQDHATWSVVGIDTDQKAIERGKKMFAGSTSVDLRVLDAQKPFEETSFDAVIALSAIEHVVDRPAFLKTVWRALKPGGVALLNYDAGHFRSRDFKERLMVPISQLLALVKIEGPYMKRVDDALFRQQAESLGFRTIAMQKNNLYPLKGNLREANDETISTWYQFEETMNRLLPAKTLDRLMWSTTLVFEKP